MNSKKTHKLPGLGDAGSVVAASSSVAVAAKRLGVERSTVYRWIEAGKVPKPGGVVVPVTPEQVTGGLSAEAWAGKVRAERELDATGVALLDLAVGALTLTSEGNHPATRLSAMTRFQALVKQLRLDGSEAETGKPAGEEPEPVRVPRVRRVTHDPRRVLMAVK